MDQPLCFIETNVGHGYAAEAGDVAGFYVLDVEFHKLIVDGMALRHAREILDGLRSHLERVRRIALSPPGRLPTAYAEHKRIFDAIAAKNGAAAAAAMRAHLTQHHIPITDVAPIDTVHRQLRGLLEAD